MQPSDWHIGTMGFAYKGWVGPFYPAGTPAKRFLGYYSQHFDSIEIDSTFYGSPRREQVQRWTAVTPPSFTFSLKTPKAITHELGLNEGREMMGQFLDIVASFGEKLGVILLQFGPHFTAAATTALDQFLSELPDDKRFAVEFRHPSWENAETNQMLSAQGVCRAAADYIHMPQVIHRTADFLYLRFIGPHGQFGTKDREMVDTTPALQRWLAAIEPHQPYLSQIYVYMNNDFSGFSPATCNRFKELAGLPGSDIRPMTQGRLF